MYLAKVMDLQKLPENTIRDTGASKLQIMAKHKRIENLPYSDNHTQSGHQEKGGRQNNGLFCLPLLSSGFVLFLPSLLQISE
jgi:hypothetical protein